MGDERSKIVEWLENNQNTVIKNLSDVNGEFERENASLREELRLMKQAAMCNADDAGQWCIEAEKLRGRVSALESILTRLIGFRHDQRKDCHCISCDAYALLKGTP